jgi:hypothetical protein
MCKDDVHKRGKKDNEERETVANKNSGELFFSGAAKNFGRGPRDSHPMRAPLPAFLSVLFLLVYIHTVPSCERGYLA